MTAAPSSTALVRAEPAAEGRTAALNTAARAARNAGISAARARGEPWAQIAQRYRLSVRQARRAHDEHVESRAGLLPLIDPNAALAEAVETHREVVREAGLLVRRADNDNAKVGALRVQAEASRKLLDLLSWAGLVPDSAGAWSAVRDVRRISEALRDICADYGLPLAEVYERFVAVDGVGRALGAGPPSDGEAAG